MRPHCSTRPNFAILARARVANLHCFRCWNLVEPNKRGRLVRVCTYLQAFLSTPSSSLRLYLLQIYMREHCPRPRWRRTTPDKLSH